MNINGIMFIWICAIIKQLIVKYIEKTRRLAFGNFLNKIIVVIDFFMKSICTFY